MTDVSHYTDFDYVIIAVMLLSCIFAYFRGLVREILSLAAWIGAGLVTIYYFPSAAARLQQHFRNPNMAAGIAGIGIYLGSLIGFGMINLIIIKSIKRGGESGVLDNMLGLMFGAARGALMVSLAFFLLTFVLPPKEYPDWLKTSVTLPYLQKGAAILASAAPNYLRDITSLEKKLQENAQGSNDSAPPPAPIVAYDAAHPGGGITNNVVSNNSGNVAGANPAGENIGYSPTATQQLNRLIDSTTNQ